MRKITRKRLVSAATTIIRGAAKLGIESAGATVMGPAWPSFKLVLTPVVTALEKRFFPLEQQSEEQARAVSEMFIEALNQDPRLQKMLTEGFSKLESGQDEILGVLDRLEDLILVVAGDVKSIKKGAIDHEQLSAHRFDKLIQAVEKRWGQEGSREVDRYDDRRAQAQAASEASDLDLRLLLHEGRQYYDEGNYDASIDSFSKAISYDQDNHYAYFTRGMAYYCNKKDGLAIRDYKKAIELDPAFPYAYTNLGMIYTIATLYDEAIELFSKALTLSPNLPVALYERGKALVNKREYQSAIADFNRQLELSPHALDGLCYRGYSLEKLGQKEEAINDYRNAVAVSEEKSDMDSREIGLIKWASRHLKKLGGNIDVQS